MRAEVIDDLTRHINSETEIASVTKVDGGFTGAEKYRISGEPIDVFLKAADLTAHADEAVALDTEAASYQAIAQLPGVQKYFPKLMDYKRDESTAALFITYLDGVTWGGPWNGRTIGMLDSALREIHSTPVPPQLGTEITSRADALQDKLRQQSQYTFDRPTRLRLFEGCIDRTTGDFINSRGLTYFTATPEEVGSLLTSANQFDPEAEQAFVIWDMTYGNLGFSPTQAYIVDPVYVDLGVPASDRARAGINILRILEQESAQTELFDLVEKTFLIDKAAVAHEIAYFMACTALDYEGQEDYMDFQQACGVAGLNAWRRLGL